MLTICAFKWGDKYTMEHVDKLYNMLRRNLTIPWEFALITDSPLTTTWRLNTEPGAPGFRFIPLWSEMREAKLCGVRLRAFGKDMAEVIGPRFAWIDLDVVITDNVDHIFGRKEDFIALSTPQGPLAYNGSLVMMDAGSRSRVFDTWEARHYEAMPAYYAKRGMHAGGQSDEGWVTFVLGSDEWRFNHGWGQRNDGIYFFRKDLAAGAHPLPIGACMVIMNGHRFDPSFPAMQALPWVREHWR